MEATSHHARCRHDVPAKQGKIGVKNHGLNTAFAIGNEVVLRSAGRTAKRTLFARGLGRPYPGATPEPVSDSGAPTVGCRIEVAYRRAAVVPPEGEAAVLMAIGNAEVERWFMDACRTIPDSFLGIVSPDGVRRYEIILRHWRLGEARYHFGCTALQNTRPRLFRRHCRVSGTVASGAETVRREMAARRHLPLDGALRRRAPTYFRRGRRFFVEVSWPVDGRGKPKTGVGRFRYPLGYPRDSDNARTGYGASFNAPFVSNDTRSTLAANDGTNPGLRADCINLLTDVLARITIPRWGPHGLTPLLAGGLADDDIVRPILDALVKRRDMPVVKWRAAAERSYRSKAARTVVRRLSRAGLGARRYDFVLPVANGRIDATLSLLCPRSEMQIHPSTSGEIVRLLCDGKMSGWCKGFATFDRTDVFDRVTSGGNKWFDPIADEDCEFSEPLLSRAYLDIVKASLGDGECDEKVEAALLRAMRIPDDRGRPTTLLELYSTASLPSHIPGLNVPGVVHADLVAHSLLKRRKWRRPKFDLGSFLGSGGLDVADEATRRLFWEWLRRNESKMGPRERPKLADLPIWPDDTGRLCRINDLCDPRSRRVGNVLGGCIRRPHHTVRRSKLVSAGGRAKASIRAVPTEDEVALWLERRMTCFRSSEQTDGSPVSALRAFESDLAVLLNDRSVALRLRAAPPMLPALAGDGSTQLRTTLVARTPAIDPLALPRRFLLEGGPFDKALDKLSAALRSPTASMLVDALRDDPRNTDALHARLQCLIGLTEPDDPIRAELAHLAIVPVDGKLRAPADLAISSGRRFWGDWKTYVPIEDLTHQDQVRYRYAGVTAGSLNPDTSRAFFMWLADQDQSLVVRHVPCVLRHILHENGPVAWGENFIDVPFVPARGRDGIVLVSLRTARRHAYLPDAGNLGSEVVRADHRALLAIHRVEQVVHPIAHLLREFGVRSLREALSDPKRVTGLGNANHIGDDCLDQIHQLQTLSFKQTFAKRLDALGVETDLVRHDWHKRLSGINDIRMADDVEAHFLLRNKTFRCHVSAGLDPRTGVLWIQKRDHDASDFIVTVAEEVVFKRSARPIDLLALRHALEMEIKDPSYAGEADVGSGRDADVVGEAEDERTEEECNELRETTFGHRPFEPDPTRNEPKPGPISASTPPRASPPGGPPPDSEHETNTSASSYSPLERKQIEELKKDHYASHCQMCLCEYPPRTLAPLGSYIEHEEVRRRVVEAHHADWKAAGGVRHAGNLVLLCTLHHNNYGQKLTRKGITRALQTQRDATITVNFGTNSEIEGWQVELLISDSREVVRLFFTKQHAAFWLDQDSERRSSIGAEPTGAEIVP